MEFRVTVDRTDLNLQGNDWFVYVSGNIPVLGNWIPDRAFLLEKKLPTTNGLPNQNTEWYGKVNQSGTAKADVRFRYFIGSRLVTDTGSSDQSVQVYKWESGPNVRCSFSDTEWDRFGLIGKCYSVSDGWLSEKNTKEIRFYAFDNKSIELNKCGDSKSVDLYRIILNVKTNDSDTIDNEHCREDHLVEGSVINDDRRRMYRLHVQTGEIYRCGKDLLSFRIRTHCVIEKLLFRFKIYSESSTNQSSPNESMMLGEAIIRIPENAVCYEKVCAEIINQQKQNIGKLALGYLIALPMPAKVASLLTLEKSFLDFVSKQKALQIGHRGMGRSYTRKAKSCENTLHSLKMAAEHGADFVEFDVQVTKDKIPILFHDFHIDSIEDGKSEMSRMSLFQFSSNEIYSKKLHHTATGAELNNRSDRETRDFPTLQSVMQETPLRIGFNIEIKFPMTTVDGVNECDDFFDRNVYVDTILDVILRYSGERKIVLSCFCPEICQLLAAKQRRFPILFLTQGVTKRYLSYTSALTLTSEIAIYFALSERFLGVCFHSDELLREPKWIDKARENGLACFVWGDDLDEKKNVDFFKSRGFDGVIVDKIDEL